MRRSTPFVETWRLGHRPALDGLRGVAVLSVVICHALARPLVFGFGPAGVTIFFTLSGFLITALLLEERGRTGRTSLRTFYARRARRLLPALVVYVAVTAALGDTSPTAAAAALFYVSNWYALGGGDLALLGHTWTLGIEEQFYILWPLVVMGVSRFGKHAVLVTALGGAAVSAALRTTLYDGSVAAGHLVGRSTITQVDALLAGCALAAALHGRVTQRPWSRVASFGTVAVCAFAMFAQVDLISVAPPVVCLLTTLVIFSAVRGSGYSGWLEARWLVLVGRRSYGLYMWHSFAFHYLLATVLPLPVALPLALAAAWGLTLISWRFVEQPFLRRGNSSPCVAQTGRQAVDDTRFLTGPFVQSAPSTSVTSD